MSTPDSQATRLRSSPPRQLALLVGLPAAGALLGGIVSATFQWAARHGTSTPPGGGAPPETNTTPGLTGIISTIDPAPVLLWVGIGLAVGLIAALSLMRERLTAIISAAYLELRWDDAVTRVPRELTEALVVGADVVALGPANAELARVRNTLSGTRLRAALAQHGWPEPLADEPAEPEWNAWDPRDRRLSPSAQRFLAARGSALRDRASADAEHLRRALVSQGLMIRERRVSRSWQQQWLAVRVATLPPSAIRVRTVHVTGSPTGSVID